MKSELKETQNETIRLEEEKDYFKVENLVRDAFWNIYRPGALEHYIVHNLREDSSFIKDLAYVIEKDDEIIGHINYSFGKLNLEQNDEKISAEDAVVLGPIAIKPECQKQGYGSKLIRHTLKIAEEKDIPFIIVIGDENYYSRFGFECGSKYNLFLENTDYNEENPFFMIKLNKNIFNEKNYDKGIFSNPDVFNVNEEEVDEFDKNFEYKKKRVLEGQLDI
ncbi:MAG: N-acetyltransferase [Methanobrevibacter sp.]|nr:N-acetyltransferase [Methanobrevibacter sp.]